MISTLHLSKGESLLLDPNYGLTFLGNSHKEVERGETSPTIYEFEVRKIGGKWRDMIYLNVHGYEPYRFTWRHHTLTVISGVYDESVYLQRDL